jgi:hypothetical protein
VSRDLVELSRQNVQLKLSKSIASTELITRDVHSALSASLRQTASVLWCCLLFRFLSMDSETRWRRVTRPKMSTALEIFRLWNEIAGAVERTLCEILLVHYSLISRVLGYFLLPPFSSASMVTKLGLVPGCGGCCRWPMKHGDRQIYDGITSRQSGLSEWRALALSPDC